MRVREKERERERERERVSERGRLRQELKTTKLSSIAGLPISHSLTKL